MRFTALCFCLLFGLLAGFVTGCVTEPQNQCPCVDCPCPDGGCCPDCCPCPDGGCCVDGVCYPDNVDQREHASDMPVFVPDSSDETPREQNAGEAEQASQQRNKPREGVFHCMRCRRGHVGAAWHTLHTPSGGAATWLCVRCWSQTSHAERMQYMHDYFDRLKFSDNQRRAFIVAMNALGSEDLQQ